MFFCLQQRLDGLFQVYDVLLSGLQVAVAVYEEQARQVADVVELQHVAFYTFFAEHADPGQCFAPLLPHVLVGVETYLVDFQPSVVILLVEFSHVQQPFGASVHGEGHEVEQDYLSAQVAEFSFVAVDVGECHVDDAQFAHLVAVDIQHNLSWLRLVATTFLYDGAEVFGACAVGVLLVPRIGNSTHPDEVALVLVGIEDESAAECLEAGIITICGIVVIQNEILLDFRFVLSDEAAYHRVPLLESVVTVCGDASCLALHVGKFNAEQTNAVAGVAAFHTVAERQAVQACLYAHCLGAVDGKIDALSADAETIELRTAGGFFSEAEHSVVSQPDAVDGYRAFAQRQVFQVEHTRVGVADTTFNAECLLLFALAQQNKREE